MGYGDYDLQAHRAATQARAALSTDQVFTQGACHPSMNPHGVKLRESRDSEAHPCSVGVVFALDVSGSMGEVPRKLATETLPTFMAAATSLLPDAQVMFIAFGHAWADRSPLQVGQFESEAALIDQWLSRIHLEGGGGGLGESYDLPMHFASRHTAMDCTEKRARKGYFFMTGDEPPFVKLIASKANEVLGTQLHTDIAIHEVVAELTTKFHPFFLIPDAKSAETPMCLAAWRALLHERVVILDRADDTAAACAALIGIQEGALRDGPSIDRWLEETLGRTGEARDRVTRAVLPYCEALKRGPIAAPEPLHEEKPPAFAG
ncbi:MAG: vWA domain-containing protein [Polyangiales bacterium]